VPLFYYYSAGNENVYDFATTTGTVVQSSGEQDVYDYATASNTVVDGGGNHTCATTLPRSIPSSTAAATSRFWIMP
jgi:autotransporter passenger strand-loop-strand repeat protein